MSIRHRFEAWAELYRRYREVWQHFWIRRDELAILEFNAQEAEFLPAALSLQAEPVSPAGRWVARILIVLIIIALSWAYLGKVDIIVNAQARIIPTDRTKSIAAIEIGSVRAIHVSEGQLVQAGDVLIELDTRASEAERLKAEGELELAELQATRSQALLEAIDTGHPPRLKLTNDKISLSHRQEAEQHLSDQWLDFIAKCERFDGEIQRFERTLPLIQQRANDYAELARTGDVSRHAWLEKEQQRTELEGQLREARLQKTALIAEMRKTSRDTLNDAHRIMTSAQQEAQQALIRTDLLKLVAPIAGTVQQLAVHTLGTAIPAAQPLMQIVPQQGGIEIEAFIENKDIGFVSEGQPAEVKLDAFEYTRYGTVPAKVSHVGRDALQDEKRGLIYSVKVTLLETMINIEQKEEMLVPGMSGRVEIKTGNRRVIEYVLSPLLQHVTESLHER